MTLNSAVRDCGMIEMKEEAVLRGAVLGWVLDIIGEEITKAQQQEGKMCQDCPALAKITRRIRLAIQQETGELIDSVGERYVFN